MSDSFNALKELYKNYKHKDDDMIKLKEWVQSIPVKNFRLDLFWYFLVIFTIIIIILALISFYMNIPVDTLIKSMNLPDNISDGIPISTSEIDIGTEGDLDI